MKRSTERILTTHTGSLPRPPDLQTLLFARESGEPIDLPAFAEQVRAAVNETVRKQVAAGIDVVNDGEMSKISYSTYVKDRLTGFGGRSERKASAPPDIADFPGFAKRLPVVRQRYAMPFCNGPVSYRGKADV